MSLRSLVVALVAELHALARTPRARSRRGLPPLRQLIVADREDVIAQDEIMAVSAHRLGRDV